MVCLCVVFNAFSQLPRAVKGDSKCVQSTNDRVKRSTAQPAVCGHTRGIRWRENIGGGWGILCVPPFLRHHSFLLLFSLSRSQKHCLGSFALAINSFIYGFTLHFLHFKRAQEVQRQSALNQQQTRLRPTQCCFSDTLPRGGGARTGGTDRQLPQSEWLHPPQFLNTRVL